MALAPPLRIACSSLLLELLPLFTAGTFVSTVLPEIIPPPGNSREPDFDQIENTVMISDV